MRPRGASVERLQVGLDPSGAGLRGEEALARVVRERQALVGGAGEVVRERDERARLVAARLKEGADVAHPEERQRLVVAARGRGAYAARGVVALYREAHGRGRLGPLVLQEVPEGDGQVRRVRPLLARQRAVLEASHERENLIGRAEGRKLRRK